ncbi:uncharacterized protein LOC117165189 [Bombus vancouverensis nearcticus]|uniref:uncharacterized protein LOC117165189 n=1 Tax=Bombus vancouverensis nearcticus TaxID=2705178 RepID=UPI00402B6EB8
MNRLVIVLTLIKIAYGLVGYDCNGNHLNVTTISLNSIGDCSIQPTMTETQDIYIQLLQLSEFEFTNVRQCKVQITRIVYYCGMHSHTSAVHNGFAEYLHETTDQQCARMHQDSTFSLGPQNLIVGLKDNATETRSLVLAGKLTDDGSCQGTQYVDPYGSWEKVVVQVTVRISLKSAVVPVRIEANKILLKSGTVCTFSEGNCLDAEDGYTYWQPQPPSPCKFDQYDVLYEGIATKIQEIKTNRESAQPVYALTTQEVTFALTKTGEQPLCGYTLLSTEHPKLFLLETTRGNTFISKSKTAVENLDIFAYVNSKFIYVEKHIKRQMTTLCHDILTQRCTTQKKLIENALSLAILLPDEFAYTISKTPGHMALIAGEAVHIVKCIPVQVKVRHTTECYSELPVWQGNRNAFLTPKTHILTQHGNHRECSAVLPTLYNIDGLWHKFVPKPMETIAPQELRPDVRQTWQYSAPSSLATSGIYTQKDLDALRDHVMFPAEKSAVLNTLARGAIGKTIVPGTVNILGMMDENTLTTIVKNTVSSLWIGFMEFGTVSAAIFGILVIFKLIQTIIDIAIHGYQLRETYGCGIALLGAICGSVIHLLLYLKRKRNIDDQTAQPQGISITPVVTQQPTPSTSALSELRDTISQISKGNLNSKGGGVTSRAPHAP